VESQRCNARFKASLPSSITRVGKKICGKEGKRGGTGKHISSLEMSGEQKTSCLCNHESRVPPRRKSRWMGKEKCESKDAKTAGNKFNDNYKKRSPPLSRNINREGDGFYAGVRGEKSGKTKPKIDRNLLPPREGYEKGKSPARADHKKEIN